MHDMYVYVNVHTYIFKYTHLYLCCIRTKKQVVGATNEAPCMIYTYTYIYVIIYMCISLCFYVGTEASGSGGKRGTMQDNSGGSSSVWGGGGAVKILKSPTSLYFYSY